MRQTKQVIRVERVSTKQLQALEAKGYTVMISDSNKRLKALQDAAQAALKRGDVETAKSMRLKMFRLILNQNKEVSNVSK